MQLRSERTIDSSARCTYRPKSWLAARLATVTVSH